jgi:hypothetical protein
MLEKISFIVTSGGYYCLRAMDLATSSRITWVAMGVFTAWYFGSERARCLQHARLQKSPSETHLGPCTLACPRSDLLQCDIVEDECKAICDKNHFSGPLNKQFHNIRHADGSVHTQQECSETHCVPDLEQDTVEKICDGCSKPHVRSRSDGLFHSLKHLRYKRGPLPLWRHVLPCCGEHATVFAFYSLFLFVFATGAGRIPVSARALVHIGTQTAAKVMDGIMISSCFIGEIQVKMPKDEELPKAKQLDLSLRERNWRLKSTPAVLIGLAYFGLRIADGWFMASMPTNTAPFVSLVSKLAGLRAA